MGSWQSLVYCNVLEKHRTLRGVPIVRIYYFPPKKNIMDKPKEQAIKQTIAFHKPYIAKDKQKISQIEKMIEKLSKERQTQDIKDRLKRLREDKKWLQEHCRKDEELIKRIKKTKDLGYNPTIR